MGALRSAVRRQEDDNGDEETGYVESDPLTDGVSYLGYNWIFYLICAFAAGNPQPLTFVLGLTHGLLWIFMSLACLTAARLRIVTLRLAVAVAVLGGIAPFFGSFEFIREQRKRAALE